MRFDKKNYLKEMKVMVDKAIGRLLNENSKLKIYSVSIWTDPNAAVSAINFDTKANSENVIKKLNVYFQKRYDEHLAEGDLEMAELCKPISGRNSNPAEFKLRNFEKINHSCIPKNWESETDGRCWIKLKAALCEIGEYAFQKMQALRLEKDFELAINSDKDWYDKKWNSK